MQRTGVRPHGRVYSLTGYHGRPPGRLSFVAALRAALVQPRCRMAACVVSSLRGRAVAHMGVRGGSVGPHRVSGACTDYVRELARFIRVLNTILSFRVRRRARFLSVLVLYTFN